MLAAERESVCVQIVFVSQYTIVSLAFLTVNPLREATPFRRRII